MQTSKQRQMKTVYSDGIFNVSPQHGFLPVRDPLHTLPKKYAALQSIMDEMPVFLKSGKNGLLFTPGAIHKRVKSLPNLVEFIKQETDPFVLQALFRSFAFLTSAYLLEPSYHHFLKTTNYGKALRVLPENVAIPFSYVAKKLDVFPWTDYHYAYSLGNYVRIDQEGPLEWTNLRMANCFSGTKDEIGFIMVHVDLNRFTPNLIKSIYDTFDGLAQKSPTKIRQALQLNADTMKSINERRREMWKASRHKHYNDFRIFILGITGNVDVFGQGVLYEGVSDELQSFRGQTGAQDDIIPTQDIFTGLFEYYPKNELTEYLLDLRKYRPKVVQAFFEDLGKCSENLLHRLAAIDIGLLEPLLRILDEIYKFRSGHWQFVQRYIMENTKYEVATGGTPVTCWLVNQIEACLKYIETALKLFVNEDGFAQEMRQLQIKRVQLLREQTRLLQAKNYNVKLVHDLHNFEFDYK